MFLLDGRDTSHLHGSLDSTAQEESSERRPVGEQLNIRLGLVLVLKGDTLLDLGILGLHPGVQLISMSMELGESLEALLRAVVVNQPTGRLRIVRQRLRYTRCTSNRSIHTSGKTTISKPKATAGMIWIPKGSCHWALFPEEKPIYVP
jgi:hypothetical protein